MKNINFIIRNYFFVILLVILEIALFITNFKQNTFFVGWDNLMPELNFKANFERSLFGVWQEYRGLGLLDGMSFTANLIHYLFIFLLDIFLPKEVLRYLFVFLMHLVGGIGMFLFLRNKVITSWNEINLTSLISFCGGLFYMFNLATIQMFYVPYELFLVHFAFLPFLINSLINLLENSSLKNIAIFSLFSFLATPQAHVPTVFIVYILMVLTIIAYRIFLYKKTQLKNAFLALGVIIIFNSFWMFPFIYSSVNKSAVIMNSKINQLTNEDVFSKNRQRGNLLDVLYLKGFMLDEVEMQKNQRMEFIMQPWLNYMGSANFQIISTIFLEIFLLGLIAAIYTRNKILIPFIIVFVMCFAFLATNTPIVGNLTDFLRDKIPLFREIFRFTFTKFSIMLVFCMSIIFSFGLRNLLELISKILTSRKIVYSLPLLVVFSIIYNFWPSFQGYFLYDAMRVRIPDEYFQTINFFKSQDKNARIVALPMPTFWNWKFYNFGTRGSGFIWYGIPQAITDRAFDPWSSENEIFYWEMSYAIYSKNVSLIEDLTEKYQMSYLLLDKNMINPLSPKSLYLDELEKILGESKKFKIDQQFNNIKIYRVNLDTPIKKFTYLASGLPNIGPKYTWNNLDSAYQLFGHYKTEGKKFDYYFPYRSLFTGKNVNQREFQVLEDDNSFKIITDLPGQLPNNFKLPDPASANLTFIDPAKMNELTLLLPEVKSDGKKIETLLPKVNGQYITSLNPSNHPDTKQPMKCADLDTKEGVFIQYAQPLENQKGLRLTSNQNGRCRISFWVQHASHQNGYLVSVTSRYLKGRSIYMWIENVNISRPEIEAYLPKDKEFRKTYFILPPLEKSGLSYTLHFDNIAAGNKETINDLAEITISPIPFSYLTNAYYDEGKRVKKSYITQYNVKHPNIATYIIDIEGNIKDNILVLSQAFDKGWVAFSSKGKFTLLSDHQLINNWANGWRIEKDGNQRILIFYLPQILEFIGFSLILIFIFYMFGRWIILKQFSRM